MGRAVFYMTAKFSKQEVLQEILKCAKETLTTEEVNKWLLATDDVGMTVFLMEAEFFKQELLQEILNWAK
jgi:hypothetical protein